MNQENPLYKSTLSLEKNLPLTPKNLKGILGDWEVKPKKFVINKKKKIPLKNWGGFMPYPKVIFPRGGCIKRN